MSGDVDTAESLSCGSALRPNVDELTLRRNRKANEKAGWLKFLPPAFSVKRAVLVGGGPSIAGFVEAIADLRSDGFSVVTMNGSHEWCLNHGIFPDVHVALDARASNARFLAKPVFGCRYLINECCHPSILEKLPRSGTFLWDAKTIRGGSTAMLCAPALLKKLGVEEMHFFGFDSCLFQDTHHAYPQPENDSDPILEVPVYGKVFRTTPWMMQQAEEFLELCEEWGKFSVYGEGLIATVLREDTLDDVE